MSRSINTDLHHSEISTIASCNLDRDLLAIDLIGDGGPKVIKLSRDEVTCWQLILRFFGFGSLANKKIHLAEVASYLNRYDWSAARKLDHSSELYAAYGKVCQLANRALLHKKDDALFDNVSSEKAYKKIQYSVLQGDKVIHQHENMQLMKWNPFLQIKHVKAFLAMNNRGAEIEFSELDFTPLENDFKLSFETFKTMRIFIRHRQSPISVPNPHVPKLHVPKPRHSAAHA